MEFVSYLIIDSALGVANHKYAICFVASPQVIPQSQFEMKKFLRVLLAYAIFINFNLVKFISDLITDSTQVGVADRKYAIHFCLIGSGYHTISI